jgi:hypothetical protein
MASEKYFHGKISSKIFFFKLLKIRKSRYPWPFDNLLDDKHLVIWLDSFKCGFQSQNGKNVARPPSPLSVRPAAGHIVGAAPKNLAIDLHGFGSNQLLQLLWHPGKVLRP